MKRLLGAMLWLALLWTVPTGCQKQLFVTEPDLFESGLRLGLPDRPETDPTAGVVPFLGPVADPATVTDPERPPRYINLMEAIAIALESGTVGGQATRAPGQPTDDLVSFTGAGVAGSDAIRVFALQPAISGAAIDAAIGRFDAQWITSMSWNAQDNPTQGLSSFSNGSGADFSTALAKPLPTGGVAGITFSTNYLNLIAPPSAGLFSVINPAYSTNLQFGFEQPLWRNNGVAINQLLDSFPGSFLFPGLNSRVSAVAPEGILITRLRFDQQRAEFERRLNYMLLNVEVAYWRLYGAYVDLFSAEQGLRMSLETWRFANSRYQAGDYDPVQLAQTRAQYEQFRAERLVAVGLVLENERALRVLLGLPIEDGTRLVPADAPTLAPVVPNWEAAFQDALSLRPELVMAREDLKAKQFAMLVNQNLLRPDLRFQASYTMVGLGTRLDGSGTIPTPGGSLPSNSLKTLFSGDFANWNIGLTMNMPIGFRTEFARTRQARLELAKAYAILKDQEKKAHNILAREYRQVIEAYKTIEIRRSRRQTLGQELKLLADKVTVGTIDPTSRKFGDSLLDAQRLWAAALSEEYKAVVDYNNALVQFEFAKGTIQSHDRVVVAEGPTPTCAQVRAVEHERERTAALVLSRRSGLPPRPANPGGQSVVDHWPEHSAPALPSLWDKGPGMDKIESAESVPDFAPAPRGQDKISGLKKEAGTAQQAAARRDSVSEPQSVLSEAPVPSTAGYFSRSATPAP